MARRLSPITRSQLLARAVRYLQARDRDPTAVLARYGFARDVAEQPYLSVTVATLRAMMEDLAVISRDRVFGFHLGESLVTDPTLYTLVEHLGRSGPKLGVYLDASVRFTLLGNDVVEQTLDAHRQTAVFRTAIPGEPLCLGRHLNDCVQTVLLGRIRALIDAPFPVNRVTFADPTPRDPGVVQEFLGVNRVEVGAGGNTLSFPRELLDRPIPTADPSLHALLVDYGERLLAGQSGGSRFLGRVRQLLADQMRTRLPTVESLARAMRTSPRSLQRRLAEDDTTFHALFESVREELARALLMDTERVGEVAAMLYYADSSTFVRAFRRWAGQTPREFRAMAAAREKTRKPTQPG